MIHLEYELLRDGWATGKISNGNEAANFAISYLHDSLKDLSRSAIGIRQYGFRSVMFMDEPGKHVLVLNRKQENNIAYELRSYSDSQSFDHINKDNFESVLKGRTTVPKYINQVRIILSKIYQEHGLDGYKEKWKKHPFPLAAYEVLH